MKLSTNKTLKKLSIFFLSLLLILVGVLGIYDYIIPNNVSYFDGDELPVFLYAQAAASPKGEKSNTTNAEYRLFDILPLKTVKLTAYKEEKLIPGGMPFGVRFFTDGLMIAGFSDIKTEAGDANPAKDAGLKQGDIITHIDGVALVCNESMTSAIDACEGRALNVTYLRNNVTQNVTVTPQKSIIDGKYKTGVMVRDNGAGIGTVSFIVPDNGIFAGLGHGICDSETGSLIPISRGSIVDVNISGIEKGLSGSPGEIKGFLGNEKLGSMVNNTECGVFGVFTDPPQNSLSEALEIGLKSEVKEGDATIYCTLGDDGIKEYHVSICDINRNAEGGKCFTVKVTDPALLEKTGGIIQGMSGSPIIQNGKLIGAVTHVLVNNPAKGYGIFIENMLSMLT